MAPGLGESLVAQGACRSKVPTCEQKKFWESVVQRCQQEYEDPNIWKGPRVQQKRKQ